MKKRIYLSLLICFCTLLSAPVFSQIITETVRQLPSSKVHAQSNFEKENYEERIIAPGVKSYLPKETLASKASTEDEVTLTIELDYDPERYTPDAIVIIDDDNNYHSFLFYDGSDIIEAMVPNGTYDIISMSYNEFDFSSYSYVVMEQIEITENMTITIRPADAVNIIKGETYNLNEEEMKPGFFNEDWTEIIGGNIRAMLGSYSLIYTKSGYAPLSSASNLTFTRIEDDLLMPIYINNISDRFTIAQSRINIDKEGNFFFNKYTCFGVNSSITLENDPANYVVHTEDFQISPIGKEIESHYPAFSARQTWNGIDFGSGWGGYDTIKEHNSGEGVTLHLDNRITDKTNPNGFDLLVSSGIVDSSRTITHPWGSFTSMLYIYSSPLTVGPDNEIIYGYAGVDFLDSSFLFLDNGEILRTPSHERFTFDSKQHDNITLGSNVPMASVIMQNYYADYLEDNTSYIIFQYIGRYGESRESDYNATFVTVKHNDEELFSGNYYDLDMSGIFAEITDKAIFEATFNNSNVEVDGLVGKNYTQLIYDARKEDWTPPTVQMLQFRNTDEIVTDRFATPADGNVRLAAGDFDYIKVEGVRLLPYFYFNYNNGNIVNFYYAPYDTENWEEIALTEYPEYFRMPAFGDYYEASLAGVNHAAGTSAWYDVKIVCTDAAGNSQMQIISPAFKIGGEVGIKTVDGNDSASSYAYPNPFTDEVTIALGTSITGKATLEIYDVLGRLVHQQPMERNGTSSFKWNGSALREGVYFYKIQHNGSSQTGKVVKK